MKPSTKKTVSNKPVPAVAPEPVVTAAEPAETSNEDPTEEVVTEEVEQGEPKEPEAAEESTPAAEEPEAQPTEPAPVADKKPDGPEEVMLGSVRCTLRRMPLETVQKAMVQAHLTRVEMLRTHSSIRDLQDRMRASDGRCAPVIFTYDPEDKTIPPSLFAGVENVAAAINIGLQDVSVLLVANKDAPDAQSFLIVKQREKPANAEEDFLMRVQSHHDD